MRVLAEEVMAVLYETAGMMEDAARGLHVAAGEVVVV